jgi:hypothetical protein
MNTLHDQMADNLAQALGVATHEVRLSRAVRKELDRLGEPGDYLDLLSRLVDEELERMCKGGA